MEGREPVRSFVLTSRTSKLEESESGGMGPESLLFERMQLSRLVKDRMDEGMVPKRELEFEMSKETKEVRFSKISGRVPWRRYPLRMSEVI
jgi:hypothetical protein